MKIVIITQCILPYISPRSQRSWNLAVQFAKMGHDVTIYAILGNAKYDKYESEYGLKVRELGPSWMGCVRSDGRKQPLFTRALHKLIGKYTQFPQIELKYLVKKSLSKEMQQQIDLLITIAQPHTIHWGAAELFPSDKVKCWVADCGDPFMGNPLSTPPNRYEKVERDWCSKVNAIAIPVAEGMSAYYEEYRNKIRVIPQGFDFSIIHVASYTPNVIPTFSFSGAIYKGFRDPTRFLEYLSSLKVDFKFHVYTKRRAEFEPFATTLGNKIEFHPYIPREQLVYELSKMDFLINIVNESGVQQPSKLIDYAQSNRPILDISSHFRQEEQSAFEEFLNRDYYKATKVDNIEQYNIKNVCNQFLDVTKQINE